MGRVLLKRLSCGVLLLSIPVLVRADELTDGHKLTQEEIDAITNLEKCQDPDGIKCKDDGRVYPVVKKFNEITNTHKRLKQDANTPVPHNQYLVALRRFENQPVNEDVQKVMTDVLGEGRVENLQNNNGALRNKDAVEFWRHSENRKAVTQWEREKVTGEKGIKTLNAALERDKVQRESLAPHNKELTNALILRAATKRGGGENSSSSFKASPNTDKITDEIQEDSSWSGALSESLDLPNTFKEEEEEIESPFPKIIPERLELDTVNPLFSGESPGNSITEAISNLENSPEFQKLKEVKGEKIAKEYLAAVEEAMESRRANLGYGEMNFAAEEEDDALSNFLKLAMGSLKGITEKDKEKFMHKGPFFQKRRGIASKGKKKEPELSLFERVRLAIKRKF